MDMATIIRKVDQAVGVLIQRHGRLLELDVNERAIAHKLAEVLGEQFSDHDVDCEYNRDHDEVKRLKLPGHTEKTDSTQATRVLPDIVVHRRVTDDNLLVVEMKKVKNSRPQEDENDRKKLRAFVKPPYNYEYGLFLKLSSSGEYILEWFVESEPGQLS